MVGRWLARPWSFFGRSSRPAEVVAPPTVSGVHLAATTIFDDDDEPSPATDAVHATHAIHAVDAIDAIDPIDAVGTVDATDPATPREVVELDTEDLEVIEPAQASDPAASNESADRPTPVAETSVQLLGFDEDDDPDHSPFQRPTRPVRLARIAAATWSKVGNG